MASAIGPVAMLWFRFLASVSGCRYFLQLRFKAKFDAEVMSAADRHDRARVYQRIRLATALLSLALSLSIPLVLVASGLARTLSATASGFTANPVAAVVTFAALCGLLYGAVSIPFSFLTGWVVERSFGMGRQSLPGWLLDRAKGLLIGVVPALALVVVFAWSLETVGVWWWVPVAATVTLFSLVLNRVGPVLLMRLFYRLTPLPEGELRDRLSRLCERTGFRMEGIFAFNLSKTTAKANAALAGIGGSRRVLLADTLLSAFSSEEIETIVAHELGHHVHRHVLVGMVLGAVGAAGALCAAALLHAATLGWAGAASVTDLSALPLVPFWLTVVSAVGGPAGNALSRRRERQADVFAVRLTGNGRAFASALAKLGQLNLAETEPHRIVEFLFYSHPSLGRRIAVVEGR